MEPVSISIAETQKVTGLGRTTIHRLINSGQLDRVKVGTRTLITFASVKRLITPQAGRIGLDEKPNRSSCSEA
ncbi:MAG: helix-turn-helix domain-containing protein [Parvularcula sp.]|jgi:excisionase family DNA binding protein|nr:helix-turn-helix domain-containing protein [Parvularcula sp.]